MLEDGNKVNNVDGAGGGGTPNDNKEAKNEIILILNSESETYYKDAMIGDGELVNNPHDKYFKTSIRDVAITKNVIKLALPSEIVSRIVWKNMKPMDTGFIDDHFNEKQCDALIEVDYIKKDKSTTSDETRTDDNGSGDSSNNVHSSDNATSSDTTSGENTHSNDKNKEKVRIYFLEEHKSYPDPEAIYKIFSYKGVIWAVNVNLLKKKGEPIKLVPIISILFAHGDNQPDYAKNFNELFGDIDDLLKESVMNFPIYVINTKDLNDDDFNACFRFKLFMMVMKYIHKPIEILLNMFETILESVSEEVRANNKWFIYFSASYVMGARKDFDKKAFQGKVKQKMTEEVFMSTLSILVREGEERGEKRGEENHAIKMAKKMILSGESIDKIEYFTELDRDTIKKIMREMTATDFD